MNSITISIFGNKIFSEIISEIRLFSKFDVKYYEDLNLCLNDTKDKNCVYIFFINEKNQSLLNDGRIANFPSLWIKKTSTNKNIPLNHLIERLNTPFTILDFEKKVILLLAKSKFQKNSLIKLNDYTIDKNERTIKKNNTKIQLSEKEINFLILFSENNMPVSRNFVLKNVWNYSPETETHTVETHIHRLRKKIFEKFGDNNFIKNNKKGYYI